MNPTLGLTDNSGVGRGGGAGGGGRGEAGIVRAWRRLTGGEPTVLACSGGADSSALVLALAAGLGREAGAVLVVGHVVHDLRAEEEALGDRDAAAKLAGRLGLVFAERRVQVKAVAGNAEANARKARYAALGEMARERGLRFVATGHQSDDQLETVLMRLLRGSGAAGLRGIAERRRLEGSGTGGGAANIVVVRPMLVAVDGIGARGICAAHGWAWREDATNGDRTRLRSRVRHEVVPVLKGIEPSAGERAGRVAELMREVHAWSAREVAGLMVAGERRSDGARAWVVAEIRRRPSVVVGGLLRAAFAELRGGAGMDRLGRGQVGAVVRAVKARRAGTARWDWAGVVVEVSGEKLVMRKV
jgi:tRNA(Ile)-lysidine synthase